MPNNKFDPMPYLGKEYYHIRNNKVLVRILIMEYKGFDTYTYLLPVPGMFKKSNASLPIGHYFEVIILDYDKEDYLIYQRVDIGLEELNNYWILRTPTADLLYAKE